LIVGVCCATVAAHAGDDKGPPQPATLAGHADRGTIHLYKNEENIAKTEFRWQRDGQYESTATIAIAGQTMTQSLKIEVDDDGRFTKITSTAPTGTVTLERDGEVARRTIKDDVVTIELQPQTMLFDNLSPALMLHAIHHYDADAAGKQSFDVCVMPGSMVEVELERRDVVERRHDGQSQKFTRYRYGFPGLDITVWVDAQERFCLAEIPAQYAAFVRKGYEHLRQDGQAAATDAADVEIVVDDEVMVPMRDGVELATDVYRPAGDEALPTILIRTPYKKEMVEVKAKFYARRGYAVAVQDCRGRFASGGVWEPFIHEADDGYDAIEWLATQPWSSGKIGMIGGSYLGWVQWWAASRRPPHLVTIIPNVSPPDPLYNIPYEYGVFFMLGSVWWADVLESEATGDLSGVAMSKIGEKKFGKLLRALPVIELDKAVLGKENKYWRKWIQHPSNDSYWAPANFSQRLAAVDIPVFHQSGWFDGDGIGSKLNYLLMRSHGHDNQKLVLGPWGHTDTATRKVGDRDFGPTAIIDLQDKYLRWFEHWLKGADSGILDEPLVSIFVMGRNEWLHGPVYPLPETRFEKWYLHSDGGANTLAGDGRLSPELPNGDAAFDEYVYDPGDPTPSPRFYEQPEAAEGEERSAEELEATVKAHYADVLKSRADILVYRSAPLETPLTIAGPISAVLTASTSARDTDWFMRLGEVDEDGRVFPLAEGKIRARYRTSLDAPQLLDPDSVHEYTLDLWQTGIEIPAGRRIQVEVASASFPLFSRNLNTGGHNELETDYVSATQRVYHEPSRPSYVLLPVIPAGQ
jgi:putative CocE/NonD family hydrolase